MNTKILASVLVVGVALMMGVAGGIAMFSDTETSSGNTFTAGTLDLTVDDEDGASVPSFTISDVAPGDTETLGPVTLKNNGTIDAGTLSIEWSVTSDDGTNVEPEPDGHTNIDEKIEVTVWFKGNDVTDDVQDAINDTTDPLLLSELDGQTASFACGMASGVSRDVSMDLTLQDVGNGYQGDKATIDVTFGLEQ